MSSFRPLSPSIGLKQSGDLARHGLPKVYLKVGTQSELEEDLACQKITMASQLLPLELIDKCVGSRIWVIMKGDKGDSVGSQYHDAP